MKPFVVIPVFNRRETTVGCLGGLREDGVMGWAQVVVVDDGSTDGTVEAIREGFPTVVILPGSGNLWWGGAMAMGMRWAYEQGAEEILWLNDDAQPRKGVLEMLVKICRERQAIVTAQGVLRETGEVHYGGLWRTRTGVEFRACTEGEVTACDAMCGNCVCIPRVAMERIGFVDAEVFPHFAGDADFGLRAVDAGVPVVVATKAICECSYGSAGNRQSWLLGEQSLRALWRGCFHKYNGALARCGWAFKWRHWGLWGVAGQCGMLARLVMISMIRVLTPRAVLLRLAAQQNVQHQRIEAVKQWEAAKSSSVTPS